jgi:hypothetical protein
MRKNECFWVQPNGFDNRPSVLVSWCKENDAYEYMHSEWLSIIMSQRMIGIPNFSELRFYEYNMAGEVRKRLLPHGVKRSTFSHHKKINLKPIDHEVMERIYEESSHQNGPRYIPIKLYGGHRFVAGGWNIYMPQGEICVGNGLKSYRFDTHKEATYFMGFDTAIAERHRVERDGWRVERGWPQPFVMKHGNRGEEYFDQYRRMREICIKDGRKKKKGDEGLLFYWEKNLE